MRICFVSRELAPYGGGGIGTYVALMARSLAERGHPVHVLTQAHPGLPDKSREGIVYHAVEPLTGAGRADAFAYFPQRWAAAVHDRLSALHAVHPFEVIEFPEFFGEGAYALRAHRRLGAYPGVKMVVRLHTPSVMVRELNGVETLSGEAAAIDVMERDSMRDADCVLSPTHSLLALAERRFGPFASQAVVPHPFTQAWVQDLGHAEAPPEDRKEILYFGRLERRKGVHLLIPALRGLTQRGIDAELTFVGGDTPTGPAETSMRRSLERQLTPELKGKVHFEEARGRQALGAAISRATVCCFPSLWENFPNVCLEAMAFGRPVVASEAGGLAELLEEGKSGLLFPSGDARALEQALARVLTDSALASRLGAGARDRLRAYCDPDSLVQRAEAALVAAAAKAGEQRPPRLPSPGAEPVVSVVVPFFNLAGTLPRTLDSLEAQSYRDFEVLVVDDGSTDVESQQLLSRLERRGAVEVVRKRNGGLSSARNAGLAKARGRYLLPLDADDLLEPSFLSRTVEVLEADPSLAWCTSWVRFFSETDPAWGGGWIPLGHAPELMLSENVAGSCTALFRREALEQVGGYDESFPAFEDWDLYCSLLERGLRGVVLPEFLFHYRIRATSLAHGMTPELRHALRAKLIAKHPSLVSGTALRRLLAESEGARATLALPRHAWADRVNGVVKRLPGVHRMLKRTLQR